MPSVNKSTLQKAKRYIRESGGLKSKQRQRHVKGAWRSINTRPTIQFNYGAGSLVEARRDIKLWEPLRTIQQGETAIVVRAPYHSEYDGWVTELLLDGEIYTAPAKTMVPVDVD